MLSSISIDGNSLGEWILGIFIIMILAAIYLLPAMIAVGRFTKRRGWIFLLNLLAGWMWIGWIVCFVWACVDEKV